MKFYFIRHGQTDWNVEQRIQGSTDIPLNEKGIEQGKLLAEKLKERNISIKKIYSSDQKRAVKTAQLMNENLGVDIVYSSKLREVKLGKWEGLTWNEVREKYKEEYDVWYQNRRYTRPPEGESYQDVLDRVIEMLHEIEQKEEKESSVAIVTHGAVIMSIQCYIHNTPFEQMTNFKTKNTEIVEIDSACFSM